jgi:uncharacterized protein YuzE
MNALPPSSFDAFVQEITMDLDAEAVYVRVHAGPVASTKPWDEAESIIIDRDASGHLVGIEVLGLSTEIPIDELSNAFDFSETVIRALKELQESMWQVSVSTAGRGGGIVPVPTIHFSRGAARLQTDATG